MKTGLFVLHLVVCGSFGFGASSRSDCTPAAADVATLRKILTSAESSVGHGKQKFDDEVRKQLTALIDKIGAVKLREFTRQFLPELERAAILHARIKQLLADVEAVKGIATTEPGGPQRLRDIVGDEPMQFFTKLTGIDVYDRAIPIKS